jgi:hypothetical protein
MLRSYTASDKTEGVHVFGARLLDALAVVLTLQRSHLRPLDPLSGLRTRICRYATLRHPFDQVTFLLTHRCPQILWLM